MSVSATTRTHLWLAGLGYLVFVIYGSLVPLNYRAMPLDAAVDAFRQIPWLQLGIGSRADWVANLLLFIPLVFIFTGALAHGRGVVVRLLASALVLAAGIGLSLGIEFTQLFFPQRTVSQNDIAAESLGAVIGIVAWWAVGRRFLVWYESWLEVRESAALSERLVWAYLVFVFAYNILPLDLTISAVEIFHKWREGKLILIPFSGLPADPAHALYEVITDALIWLPPAFIWRFRGGRTTAQAWWLGVVAALVLEVLQLFVYSRVSDVTDVITAALGAWVGAMLGARLGRRSTLTQAGTPSPVLSRLMPLVLAAGWVLVLMVLFWYPFDFRTDGAFIRERMAFLERVPFEVYYYGSEFRAITEVFHKVLFFAPLGVLLAWFVVGLPWLWRGYAAAASMTLIVMSALGIELGQTMLPGKIPDTTDWVLECLGGILGYLFARNLLRRLGRSATVVRQAMRSPQRRNLLSGWIWAMLLILLLTLLIWSAGHSSVMPYNVRELFDDSVFFGTSLSLAWVVYLTAACPVWVVMRQREGPPGLMFLLVLLLLEGVLVYALLRLAVPMESLYDLVGNPVLGWTWEWEILGRFAFLHAMVSSLLVAAVLFVEWISGKPAQMWLWPGILWLLFLGDWVVVRQAATDNLVELLAPHRFAALAVWLWFITVFLAASTLAFPWPRGRRWVVLLVLPLSLLLSAFWMSLGLAWNIEKYGKVFSALSFLISTDRDHYVTGFDLWFRYAGAHFAVITGLALIQWPLFRFFRVSHRGRLESNGRKRTRGFHGRLSPQ